MVAGAQIGALVHGQKAARWPHSFTSTVLAHSGVVERPGRGQVSQQEAVMRDLADIYLDADSIGGLDEAVLEDDEAEQTRAQASSNRGAADSGETNGRRHNKCSGRVTSLSH